MRRLTQQTADKLPPACRTFFKGELMKIRELLKVQRVVVLLVLAALVLVALRGSTLTAGATRQQGRGRVTARQAEVKPAEVQSTELDAEAQAALAEIQKASSASVGPFDIRVI